MSNRKPDNALIVVENVKDDHIIQFSRPLFGLWSSDLSIFEYKILNLYLSQINSRDPEHTHVRIPKGELERVLGVKRIKTDVLESRLTKLMSHVVKLEDPENRDNFVLISLFESAACKKDKDGVWQIDLECTRPAMKYCFNVEKFGYIKYTINLISQINSIYALKLFQYLLSNVYRCTWEISVLELKNILGCHERTYDEFKRFNDLVLKPSQRNLYEGIGFEFTYEPVRKSRKFVALKFTIIGYSKSLAYLSAPQNTETDSAVSENHEESNADKEYVIEYIECRATEFSDSEVNELYNALIRAYPHPELTGTLTDFFDACYDKYLERSADPKSEPVSNPVAYLIGIIKNTELSQ